MMQVVSIANQKGGCAKTTTAVNLAHALCNKGRRTLLIDLDPQAHATFSLGLNPGLTTVDAFDAAMDNKSFSLNDFLTLRSDNLFVLPSSIGLSALEQSLTNHENKLEILNRIVSSVNIDFDYCIIDCPPNLGILTLNALIASDYCIAPMGICSLSLKGIDNLNNILNLLFANGKKIPSIFYLMTQFDKRFKFSEDFLIKAKDKFKNRLLSTIIRTNIHLREAASEGLSIYEYKKDSRGAKDYIRLAEEIVKITKDSSWTPLFLKGNEFNEVYLVGEFNNWQKNEKYRLTKVDKDTWLINLSLKKGSYRYKFITNNEWIDDPGNSQHEDDAYGGKNSILRVN